MAKTKGAIPVAAMFDTERIVEKSDAETFKWFRMFCYNYGALPTLKYHLHQRAGKLNDDDLIREQEYFLKEAEKAAKERDKRQKQFQELKGKTDPESQKKLIGVVESLDDYAERAYMERVFADTFANAIEENARAAENFRKVKVGAKFKAARLQNKMTQEQVGKSVGVSAMRVSDYEAGKTEPPIRTLLKLVKLFNLSLDELYEIETRKNNS